MAGLLTRFIITEPSRLQLSVSSYQLSEINSVYCLLFTANCSQWLLKNGNDFVKLTVAGTVSAFTDFPIKR